MSKILAQEPHNLGNLKGIGPLGNFDPSGAAGVFETVISNIVGVLTIIAAIWFVFQFIVGAIDWLSSEGEPERISKAHRKITSGIIGLVIVISATFLVQLIGTMMGFGDILKPARFIVDFWK